MKTIKAIWENDLYKILLSFLALVLLFLSLLVRPGLTYFFGTDITVRIVQGDELESSWFNILEITEIPLSRVDDEIETMLLDESTPNYMIARNNTVYAILDTSNDITTIGRVTLKTPSNEDVYLIVDAINLYDLERTESGRVDIQIEILENTLYQTFLDLTNDDTQTFTDVRLKVRNNHIIRMNE